MAAHVAHAFHDRRVVHQIPHPQRRPFRMGLGKAHPGDQQCRYKERERVQHEHCIAPEQRRDNSAQSRAQHEVHRPRGGRKRVRDNDVVAPRDIRNHRAPCRLEKRRHDRLQQQERIHQPHHAARAHQQHGKHDHGPHQVGRNHHVLAPDAIINHARGRSDERLRQHLQHQRQGDRTGVSGKLQEQAVDRQRVKPVANLAHNLRQPQTAEVHVLPQQTQVGGKRDRTGFALWFWFHAEGSLTKRRPSKITDSGTMNFLGGALVGGARPATGTSLAHAQDFSHGLRLPLFVNAPFKTPKCQGLTGTSEVCRKRRAHRF